jgi:hypothetical protein
MDLEKAKNPMISKEADNEKIFIEGWNQKSEKLEYLKGKIRDMDHICFTPNNDIAFWTTRGIGFISISALINQTAPYKTFIPAREM